MYRISVLLWRISWNTVFTLSPFIEKTSFLIVSPGPFSHSAPRSSSIYTNYPVGKCVSQRHTCNNATAGSRKKYLFFPAWIGWDTSERCQSDSSGTAIHLSPTYARYRAERECKTLVQSHTNLTQFRIARTTVKAKVLLISWACLVFRRTKSSFSTTHGHFSPTVSDTWVWEKKEQTLPLTS